MRLKFVEPLLPTLVEKPPEGDEWIHEVKFDGYRSQIVIDARGSASSPGAAMTGRRNIATWRRPREAGVESAIIDGEIIVLNDAGLSDFCSAAQGHHPAAA